MYGQRNSTPLIAGAIGLAVVVAVVAFLIGHATGGDSDANASTSTPSAIRVIDGVPVGVLHTRAGALAAADTYAAASGQDLIANPRRFKGEARATYTSGLASQRVNQADSVAKTYPSAVRNFADGGKVVANAAAHRLESYSGNTAQVTTWLEAVQWGPDVKPQESWDLVATDLRWDGGRWRATRIDASDSPVASPGIVLDHAKSDTAEAFDRDLHGMSTPLYGGG